jgi:protein-S-isoprenylcysteine O-methyltransferase Ste14
MSNNKGAPLGLTSLQNVIFNVRFSSCLGASFFTIWIGQRVYLNPEKHFAFNLIALTWWLITFQYGIFVVSYLTRYEAKEHARGFVEVLFPFICAAMPFALILDYPFRPPTDNIAKLWMVSTSLVIGGTLVTIAGISSLRQSFSIMTEVRKPVLNGIYGLTRHPMYVGSMITAFGTLSQNWSLWNCAVFVVFCVCQIYRATREEIKIMAVFSEYRQYALRVGWLWKIGIRRDTKGDKHISGKTSIERRLQVAFRQNKEPA